MWCKWKWVVLWSLWAARLVRQPTTPVRVTSGWLRGSVSPVGTHAEYFGIPYATVMKRFQAPGPEPTWEGILDMNNEHIRCIQRFSATFISGIEDCLTLNVYTPVKQSNTLRPVMVFIHGGGFRDGSGSPFLYGSQYLIKHDVILVTFNYRLEILGFLCLGTKEAPGNAGLKDQVAALKWVRRNIKAFGGDPDNITIFGESAGSASVMYHILSPMSQGLFQKAIMQSGSALAPWSFQFDPLEIASRLARQMGHETSDPRKMYNLFMNKTSEELLRIRVPRNDGDIVLSENIFVPCSEIKIPDIEPFLTDTPYNLLNKGIYNKVPIIMGFNSAEGYMFAGKENDTTIAKMNFYNSLPRDLIFTSEKDKTETARKLEELYMDNKEITKESLLKFSFYEGESSITYPVIATIDLILKTSEVPVFTYKLSYDGWMNFVKLYYGFSKAPGATHADDLFYIFKVKIPALLHEYMEREIITKITTMWTNFAKHSDPTPEKTQLLPNKWRATDKKDPRLLVIDKEFTTSPLWEGETILYWNATYTKYRRKK